MEVFKIKQRRKVYLGILAFALVGIAPWLATLIIVTSVMNGFSKEFTEKIIGFNGHISMHLLRETPELWTNCKECMFLSIYYASCPNYWMSKLISNTRTVSRSLCHGISKEDLIQKKLIADNIIREDINDFFEEDSIILGD